MSRSASSDSAWLPLGGAQIIDWNHLGLGAPGRGAAAWAGRVDGESVVVRTFSSENTTTFDFVFLAYDELTGQVVVTTDRSEPARLRLEVSVEVEGRLSYTDALELTENPRTGLHGATIRAVDVRQGPSLDDLVSPPTAADAEMLEYAPESALHTACGVWLASVLAAVKTRLLEGVAPSEVAQAVPADAGYDATPPPARDPEPEPAYEPDLDFEPEPEPEPEPRRAPKSGSRRPRETIDAPSPRRARTPEPPPPEPEPDVPDKLVASTNTGDSWEIVDQETFIGRSKQCAIVLKSQRVSRRHASVTIDDDGYYINDLGAANGIWAGTEKIDRERIEHGAEYIIGDVLMTFTFA